MARAQIRGSAATEQSSAQMSAACTGNVPVRLQRLDRAVAGSATSGLAYRATFQGPFLSTRALNGGAGGLRAGHVTRTTPLRSSFLLPVCRVCWKQCSESYTCGSTAPSCAAIGCVWCGAGPLQPSARRRRRAPSCQELASGMASQLYRGSTVGSALTDALDEMARVPTGASRRVACSLVHVCAGHARHDQPGGCDEGPGAGALTVAVSAYSVAL